MFYHCTLKLDMEKGYVRDMIVEVGVGINLVDLDTLFKSVRIYALDMSNWSASWRTGSF